MNRLRMFLLTVGLMLPTLLPTLQTLAHPGALFYTSRRQLQRLVHRARGLFGGQGVVLLYHRVLPQASEDGFRLAVECERFEAHLRWLRDHADVVSLDDLSAQVRTGRIRGRPVVLTFDDGYLDNHRHAAGLLRSYGFPATFYLTAGYIGAPRRFWWDEVHARLDGGRRDPTGALVTDEQQRASLVDQVCRELRVLPTAERELRLAGLGPEPPPPPAIDLPMTWEDAADLLRMGFSVGAHSITHPAFSSLDEATLHREVFGSREEIETRLGCQLAHFCYPYDEAVRWGRRVPRLQIQAVAEAGFRTAVTVVQGGLTGRTHALAMPRMAVQNWDAARFEAEISRYLPGLRSRT